MMSGHFDMSFEDAWIAHAHVSKCRVCCSQRMICLPRKLPSSKVYGAVVQMTDPYFTGCKIHGPCFLMTSKWGTKICRTNEDALLICAPF